MSVQFDPISILTPVHLGRWWTGEIRESYPVTEERPPLEPTLEQFDAPQPTPAFNFRMTGVLPSPSVWFVADGRNELLQVQRDRFTRNWAKQSGDESYPSFDALWPKFASDFTSLSSFLEIEKFGTPSVTQCELTYVNPIKAGAGWSNHGELDKVLAPWSGQQSEPFLPYPDDAQVAMRYTIPDDDGIPVGRLYVKVDSVISPEQEPVILMTLSARGRPLGPGLEGAKGFLDLAHEWIVRGFTSLTTEPMHQIWGRHK